MKKQKFIAILFAILTILYPFSLYKEVFATESQALYKTASEVQIAPNIQNSLVLVSFAGDGSNFPEGFEEATDLHFDNAGEIAGSGLTLDVACQNAMVHFGCSVCDAFRFASYNPARAVNLAGYGSIEKGNYANLIMVDDKFNVKKTIFKGELQ